MPNRSKPNRPKLFAFDSTPAREALVGPLALSDAELLTALLGPRVNAVELLQAHGGLRALAMHPEAPPKLRAALELGQRVQTAQEARPRLLTPHAIHAYMAPRLAPLYHEVVHVLCFNNRNVLLKDVRVATGTSSSCAVDPREVFVPAITTRAAGIVLVHNHPSGDPTPSETDVFLTQKCVTAAQTLGIKVLDHIVVGANSYASFLEKGLLEA